MTREQIHQYMSVEEYSQILREKRLVVVENFIDDEQCDELYNNISSTIEKGDIDVVAGARKTSITLT